MQLICIFQVIVQWFLYKQSLEVELGQAYIGQYKQILDIFDIDVISMASNFLVPNIA